MSKVNRRDFLVGSAAAAGAFSTLTFLPKSVRGANEKVHVGIAGLHNRGKTHLAAFMANDHVQVTHLIDPDSDVLAGAQHIMQRHEAPPAKAVADVRRALEDKSLDAISIATPHQWHALITVWACQAGKHVYVEKPCSHTIHGGRMEVMASRKYNVVVQHGTQQRSSAWRANQMKAILDGRFGKLLVSHGYACKPRGGIGFKPTEPPPANLNWDLWRGPARIPDDGFHRNFVHYNWHWFWITGNGEIGNQGVHQMDVARWALGKHYPKRVMTIGGRFAWHDQGETPNSLLAVMDFGDGQYLLFTVRNVNYKGYHTQLKNDFYFENYRIVNKKVYKRGEDKPLDIEYPEAKLTPGGAFGSFITAVRAGKRELCNADIEVAHYSSALGHLANISYRIGTLVPFSKQQKAFGDNKAAYAAFEELHDILKDGCQLPVDKTQYRLGPWLEWDARNERVTAVHGEVGWDDPVVTQVIQAADTDPGKDPIKLANSLLRDRCRKGYEMPTAETV